MNFIEEKLAEIRELARVGNQSKTRYVWTIHPFITVSVWQRLRLPKDLETIKAKFTQLMDVGVRSSVFWPMISEALAVATTA